MEVTLPPLAFEDKKRYQKQVEEGLPRLAFGTACLWAGLGWSGLGWSPLSLHWAGLGWAGVGCPVPLLGWAVGWSALSLHWAVPVPLPLPLIKALTT